MIRAIDLRNSLHHFAHLAFQPVEILDELIKVHRKLRNDPIRGHHIVMYLSRLNARIRYQLQNFSGMFDNFARCSIDAFRQLAHRLRALT